MSVNIIELFILGAVAFYLINKMLYIVGSIEEDDPLKNRPMNNNTATPTGLKDVTDTIRDTEENSSSKINRQFVKLKSLLPGFDENKFLSGSKKAFALLMESYKTQDHQMLSDLIDPMFLDSFKHNFDFTSVNIDNIKAEIIDIFIFGNNISIVVKFDKVKVKGKEIIQEWTFIKNASKPDPNWYLKNINEIV